MVPPSGPSISTSVLPSSSPIYFLSDAPTSDPSAIPSIDTNRLPFRLSLAPSASSRMSPSARPSSAPSGLPTVDPGVLLLGESSGFDDGLGNPSSAPSIVLLADDLDALYFVPLPPFTMTIEYSTDQDSVDKSKVASSSEHFVNNYLKAKLDGGYSFSHAELNAENFRRRLQSSGSTVTVLFEGSAYFFKIPLPLASVLNNILTEAFSGTSKLEFVDLLQESLQESGVSILDIHTSILVTDGQWYDDGKATSATIENTPQGSTMTFIIVGLTGLSLFALGAGLFIHFRKKNKEQNRPVRKNIENLQTFSLSNEEIPPEASLLLSTSSSLDSMPSLSAFKLKYRPVRVDLNPDDKTLDRLLLRSKRNRAVIEVANANLRRDTLDKGFLEERCSTIKFAEQLAKAFSSRSLCCESESLISPGSQVSNESPASSPSKDFLTEFPQLSTGSPSSSPSKEFLTGFPQLTTGSPALSPSKDFLTGFPQFSMGSPASSHSKDFLTGSPQKKDFLPGMESSLVAEGSCLVDGRKYGSMNDYFTPALAMTQKKARDTDHDVRAKEILVELPVVPFALSLTSPNECSSKHLCSSMTFDKDPVNPLLGISPSTPFDVQPYAIQRDVFKTFFLDQRMASLLEDALFKNRRELVNVVKMDEDKTPKEAQVARTPSAEETPTTHDNQAEAVTNTVDESIATVKVDDISDPETARVARTPSPEKTLATSDNRAQAVTNMVNESIAIIHIDETLDTETAQVAKTPTPVKTLTTGDNQVQAVTNVMDEALICNTQVDEISDTGAARVVSTQSPENIRTSDVGEQTQVEKNATDETIGMTCSITKVGVTSNTEVAAEISHPSSDATTTLHDYPANICDENSNDEFLTHETTFF